MAEVNVFEFPGTIAMFGLDRDQAAELLEEVEQRMVSDYLAVSYAFFSRSNDQTMLAKRGISVEGESAGESIRGETPPSPEELEECVAGLREEQASRREQELGKYAEDRKRENAEEASRVQRERSRKRREGRERRS